MHTIAQPGRKRFFILALACFAVFVAAEGIVRMIAHAEERWYAVELQVRISELVSGAKGVGLADGASSPERMKIYGSAGAKTVIAKDGMIFVVDETGGYARQLSSDRVHISDFSISIEGKENEVRRITAQYKAESRVPSLLSVPASLGRFLASSVSAITFDNDIRPKTVATDVIGGAWSNSINDTIFFLDSPVQMNIWDGLSATSTGASFRGVRVVGGDVFIDSISSGVIFIAIDGGTFSCWRESVNNSGALTATLVPSCPI